MERLYRDFMLVIIVFAVISLVLNFSPFMRCKTEKTICPMVPCETKSKKKDTGRNPKQRTFPRVWDPKQRTLPRVWDQDLDDDRIYEQMIYKPDVVSKESRTILISGSGDFDVPLGQEVFIKEHCPINNCEIIKEYKSNRKYDARIFNTIVSYSELSSYNRHPDEIWIIYILEGPAATPDYFLLGNVFNWTASYRHDSTIVTPYEKWLPNKNNSEIGLKNYAKGKSKMAAIFVSHCDTSNDRLGYVKELQKYIKVDIYGACGDLQCDRLEEQKCFDMLNRDYKFYLAFENSNCRDYITEKYFKNGLMNDIIPVVMGAHPDDYRRVSPPNSFIHIEDFSSPRQLGEYLDMLDKNDEMYNSYFRWKGSGNFINTKFWCRLCTLLNDVNKPILSVKDLNAWWRKSEICIRGDEKWNK